MAPSSTCRPTTTTRSAEALAATKTDTRLPLLTYRSASLPLPCQSIPLTGRRQWKGRLHLCSKSLFFDPDDNRNPILRFSYDKLAAIAQKQHRDTKTSPVVDYISLITRELCEIQSNTPYTFTKLEPSKPQAEYMVTLQYSEMGKLMPAINKLHDITVNTPFRQKEEALTRVIKQHEDNIQFDSSSISDIREVSRNHNHTQPLSHTAQRSAATLDATAVR